MWASVCDREPIPARLDRGDGPAPARQPGDARWAQGSGHDASDPRRDALTDNVSRCRCPCPFLSRTGWSARSGCPTKGRYRGMRASRVVQILCDVGGIRLEVRRRKQVVGLAADVQRRSQAHAGPGELELHPALAAGEVVRCSVRDVDQPEHDRRRDLDLIGAGWNRGDGIAGIVDDRERAVHRVLHVERRKGRIARSCVPERRQGGGEPDHCDQGQRAAFVSSHRRPPLQACHRVAKPAVRAPKTVGPGRTGPAPTDRRDTSGDPGRLQRRAYLWRRHRRLPDPHARRVEERVRDCRAGGTAPGSPAPVVPQPWAIAASLPHDDFPWLVPGSITTLPVGSRRSSRSRAVLQRTCRIG